MHIYDETCLKNMCLFTEQKKIWLFEWKISLYAVTLYFLKHLTFQSDDFRSTRWDKY